MVADSAATLTNSGSGWPFRSGLAKIQFASSAGIAFGLWGDFVVGRERFDHWMRRFIERYVANGEDVSQVAQRVADHLNYELRDEADRLGWTRRGIHVAALHGKSPVLYHIHNGHDGKCPEPLAVQRHFPPEGVEVGRPFEEYHPIRSVHVRSGYYRHFEKAFTSKMKAAEADGSLQGFDRDIRARAATFADLIVAIARELEAEGVGAVNDRLSTLLLTPKGPDVSAVLAPDGPADIDAWVGSEPWGRRPLVVT